MNKNFINAKKFIAGGVNSPVRSFGGVIGDPIFFKKAKGSYLYDTNDNKYIDYVGSWGPMILGHLPDAVIKAVNEQLSKGLSFGAPTIIETELAQKICTLMPTIEKLRMVNSGTEATMSAIRLARGYTKRNIIIKYDGCYHGHSDSMLVKAGSGALTFGTPNSAGITQAVAKDTITIAYNDLASTKDVFNKFGEKIAAIIVEPIAGNMGMILPNDDFLKGLRKLCDTNGSLLIFDEVMTGFRVDIGGAQAIYNIKPDITCVGKVIGGGFPCACFGGRAEIMNNLTPCGNVYQAGTLSGNPVAMAAGLATLKVIEQNDFFQQLSKKSYYLIDSIKKISQKYNISLVTHSVGGMCGIFFTDLKKVSNYIDVSKSNIDNFKKFHNNCLKQGLYFAPSAYEAFFMSSAHTWQDLEQTVEIIDNVFSNF